MIFTKPFKISRQRVLEYCCARDGCTPTADDPPRRPGYFGIRVKTDWNRSALTDGNQGNPLAMIITGDSHRLGVEGDLPIHNVGVAMMAVFKSTRRTQLPSPPRCMGF